VNPLKNQARRGRAPATAFPPPNRISGVADRILVIRGPAAGERKTLSILAHDAMSATLIGGSKIGPWELRVMVEGRTITALVDSTQLAAVREFVKAVETRRVNEGRRERATRRQASKEAPLQQHQLKKRAMLPTQAKVAKARGAKGIYGAEPAKAQILKQRQTGGKPARTPSTASGARARTRPVWLWDRFGKRYCSLDPVDGARCKNLTLMELVTMLLRDVARSEPAILTLAGETDVERAHRRLRTWHDAGVGWGDVQRFMRSRPARPPDPSPRPVYYRVVLSGSPGLGRRR
jgi:hypothetical protein